jgi:hypothetical protein
MSMPRSCSRSSTLRRESGNRTYSITARRMISRLVWNYFKGLSFVMARRYVSTPPHSTGFPLTLPSPVTRPSLRSRPNRTLPNCPRHPPREWPSYLSCANLLRTKRLSAQSLWQNKISPRCPYFNGRVLRTLLDGRYAAWFRCQSLHAAL